ncbi:MAG: hypothetical protein OXM55_00400 [Bdellovibrionales bacterium]|nr:hypothetical protein [Bdellovibrionales bacterium]
MKKIIELITITLSIAILLTGCGGTICKGEKKKVLFDYDPIFKTVDIGGYPTYHERASWVKKIIVKKNGFIVVNSQKFAGYKKVPCEEESKKGQLCQKYYKSTLYQVNSYIEGVGYKYWGDVPKKEWEFISQLEDQPSQKPNLYIKNCNFSLFGSLLEILLAMKRA